MWRKCARLLVGLTLFLAAGWLMVHAVFGWGKVWRSQQSLHAKIQPVPLIDPALAGDPSVASAKLKVIGPLANALKPQGEILSPSDSEKIESPSLPTPPTAFDHVEQSATAAPRRFHATFAVKSYRYYQLLVPPHTTSPRLHGSFTSVSAGPGKTPAIAEFLLLDDRQFSDFIQGDVGTVLFSSESIGATIDVTLSPALFEPKKYYLVFRSPDNRVRIVTSNLTATFD